MERLTDGQGQFLGKLITNENEARVLVCVLFFRYETEELFFALVVRAVGNPMERILM